MKKFLVSILAIVYLTVTSGATVNLHYCMGKLMSWTLLSESEGNCGSCGMEKVGHKGCCHDEQKQLKVEKDQKGAESALKFLIINSDAFVISHIDVPKKYFSSAVLDKPCTHAPPRLGALPIFVLNCNFRI